MQEMEIITFRLHQTYLNTIHGIIQQSLLTTLQDYTQLIVIKKIN